MKARNIVGLVAVLACSTSAFARNNFEQVLNGVWRQDCGSQGKYTMTMNGGGKLFVKHKGEIHEGQWSTKRGNLYLEYAGQKRQKWNIDSLHDDEYLISRDGVQCLGKKR